MEIIGKFTVALVAGVIVAALTAKLTGAKFTWTFERSPASSLH